MSTRWLLSLTCLTLITPVLAQKKPVTLTYLANEGALLRSGEHAVLIDAFVTQPYSIYAALSPTTWQAMLARKPPFQHIDLALVSHRHRDHFQAQAAVAFLKEHPETTLLASGDVYDDLAADAGFAAINGQVEQVLPEKGKKRIWQQGDLRVEILRIAHGGKRWRTLHNLGQVIHLGGQKILHVGDADTDAVHYKPYAAELTGIDIALVPFWFYSDVSGRQLVSEVFKARHEVAVHIPPKDRQEIATRFRKHPKVVLYGDQGAETVFPPP